uniref:EF-hand domain-containing protein n=1 Tax=uncultured marine group II/III euryarchaeote KM3_149_A03 TaxID=1457884 RepID=A0A075GIU4_9EURY|nr:hypothetical protein [uncultured marine group II/III euryarchaeote KM3_149_A03]
MPDDIEEEIGGSAVAQCGACGEIISIDSSKCPACNVSFSGVEGVDQGECGSCDALVPLDSKSCPECGISFVMDDLIQSVREWMVSEGLSVIDVFGKWDSNDDGVISRTEIRDGLLADGIAVLPEHEVDRFLLQVDLNKDQEVQLGELAAALLLPVSDESVVESSDDEADSSDSTSDDDSDASDEEVDSEEAADAEDSDESSDVDDTQDDDQESDDGDDEADDDDADEDADDGDDGDDGDDESDDDDADEEDDTDSAVDAFTRLIEAVEASSESARGLFEKLDRNESDNVDPDEFKDAVRELMDDDFSDEDLDSIISAMDNDDDGFLDIIEITSALEDPEKVIEEIEKPKREGPADWQRFLMRHYENVFPVTYVLLGIFIGIWVVNGVIGPVDGSGGPVAFDGSDTIWSDDMQVDPGDIYPCDKTFQLSGCKNSLTPLSGDSSSMPAGFYWDGIMFIILGIAGLVGIFLLSRQIKELRESHRMKQGEDEGDDDSDDDDSDDDDSDDDDSDDDDSDDDDSDDDDSDDDDDDEDDDEDDDDEEDEEIEVGSHVGVEHGGEEWSGTIVEFDDEEDEVLVKNDDDDEEVWVPFASLFVE